MLVTLLANKISSYPVMLFCKRIIERFCIPPFAVHRNRHFNRMQTFWLTLDSKVRLKSCPLSFYAINNLFKLVNSLVPNQQKEHVPCMLYSSHLLFYKAILQTLSENMSDMYHLSCKRQMDYLRDHKACELTVPELNFSDFHRVQMGFLSPQFRLKFLNALGAFSPVD